MKRKVSDEIQQKEYEDGTGDLSSIRDGKLSTGVPQIDSRLEGLPEGSVIAILGNTTLASLLNLHLVLTLRNTHYITTTRRKSVIKDQLHTLADTKDVPQQKVDENLKIEEEYGDTSGENITETISLSAGRLRENENLVIDSFSILNTIEDSEYYRVLRDIKRKTHENNGLAYLYMPISHEDLTRTELEGLHIADGVLVVEEETGNQGDVQFFAKFTKLRDNGENMPDSAYELVFGHGVGIESLGTIG